MKSSQVIAQGGLFAEGGSPFCAHNLLESLERATEAVFGVEDALIDFADQLAVAHEVSASSTDPHSIDLLFSFNTSIALVVKVDGLTLSFSTLIQNLSLSNTLFLEVSFPVDLSQANFGLRIGHRLGNLEKEAATTGKYVAGKFVYLDLGLVSKTLHDFGITEYYEQFPTTSPKVVRVN